MRRDFYLHKRKNGIFYVEFINPENGKKLSAKSTCETERYKAQVKAVLTPYFGDKKLNCVTTDDLNNLTKQLAAKGLATSTICQIRLICQTPLRWCYKKDIIPSDPTKDLTKFSIENKERGVLTIEEAKALLYSCKELWNDNRG